MDIKDIRERIDSIDGELLRLFLERMEISERVAEYKRENGLPILDRARERQVLERAGREAGEVFEPYAHQLFGTLMELSKARQMELSPAEAAVGKKIAEALANRQETFPRTGRVACQGVEGAYSQIACDKLFTRGNIVFVKTFKAVFEAVESGLCEFGIVPIENSLYGSVRAVYELLRTKDFQIVRSIDLRIRHALLAKPGTRLSDVRDIYSHEQGLGQCSRFLAGLEGVRAIPCANTALAAKQVAEGDGASAAIASPDCAELYGLEVLSDSIQDSEDNHTRFICISKKPVYYAGSDKISVIFTCPNRPGALYGILSKLSARGLNMTKLESCPSPGGGFEYVFFLDIEASVLEDGVAATLCDLERSSQGFSYLGCYKRI